MTAASAGRDDAGRPPAAREKEHFVLLDGMRGIAALAVVCLHASQSFYLTYQPHHASLAVDFFFVLSGFVVAYAYDERLSRGMTLSGFGLRRIIRLYPMIFLGVSLDLAVMIFASHPGRSDVVQLLVLGAASLFLIPLGLMNSGDPFPINPPIWSLFFEFIANGAYAFGRRAFPGRGLTSAVILTVFAIGLLVSMIAEGSVNHLGFDGKVQFVLGVFRVSFPFMAGVLIFRHGIYRKGSSYFHYAVTPILLAIFLFPALYHNWIYDAVCIFALFPFIVILGTATPKGPGLGKIWRLAGGVSYPLYLVHQPVLRTFKFLYDRYFAADFSPKIMVGLAVMASLLAAYAVWICYDQPVRRWLGSRQRGGVPGSLVRPDRAVSL